jgi:hypothetical protein
MAPIHAALDKLHVQETAGPQPSGNIPEQGIQLEWSPSQLTVARDLTTWE